MNQKLSFILCLVVFLARPLVAQEINVTGRVIGADNDQGIPGANVLIKGTSSGTVTDVEGNFSLSVDENATLIVSFVGYETYEAPVEGRSRIEVSLYPDVQSLSEIVVIGYGTQKKSDVISSVASIDAEEMVKVPSSDIGEMLRGKAPGVFVTMGDAGPGSSSNILIRGKNSISGGNAPVVIVDGIPVGNINDINPNDIASTEILKDAAAQAIYGARASNGVILITTKRGKEGKVDVGYNGYYGVQTVKRNFDIYSGEEFAQLKREAWRTDNPGSEIIDENIFTPIELEVLQSGEFIDWEKEVLRIAPIQNHNISATVGSEKASVYSSLNYFKQEGVIPGTDFERATLRLNADQKITNWLSIGLNTSFQISEKDNPGAGNTLNRTFTTSPLGKIYNEDGSYRLNPTGVQESFNPLLDIHAVTSNTKSRNDIINLFVDISPFEGFNYRLNASRRSWNAKNISFSTGESLIGIQNNGLSRGSIQFQDNMEYQLENIFTYDRSFGKHNLGLTFVQSATEAKYSTFSNQAINLTDDLRGIYGLVGAEVNNPSIGANRRSLLSFVGRVQYDYDGRYYLTVSSRADASSVFGANNRWANFPAVGVGWNVHRERFFDGVSMLNNLKLRASYGSVGNQAISPYQSLSTANQIDYVFGGSKATGYAPGNFLPNPSLRWETSTTLNAAIDFAIWQSRISGTVELYNTRTTDLLVQQALDASLGYTRRWTNLGEIENEGIELSLNAVAVERDDFVVNVGVQFSKNRNKIISLYGEDSDGDGVEDNDLANSWFIGQPIDVYYQYKAIGIYQQGEDIVNSHQPNAQPGYVKLYDRDPSDGILNADDRVITKKDPDWYGSVYADVNFKGFDLSVQLITVQGVVKNNPFLYNYVNGGSLRGVLNGVKQDYWTPENPTGNWPRPRESNDPEQIYALGLQDASYFRIQNVTLGYSLSESLLSRLRLSNLRLYVTAQNPLTITDFQSYSPEKNPNDYPEAISLIGGLQIGF